MPQPSRPEGEVAQPGTPATAPDPTPRPVQPTGTSSTVRARPAAPVGVAGTYSISRFLIRYAGATEGKLPPEDVVMSAKVDLEFDGVSYSPARVQAEGDLAGLVGREGQTSVRRAISELNTVPGNYTPAAISAVCSSIVRALNDAGFVAIFVLPSADDISETGGDIRGGRRELTLVVYAGRVRAVTATVIDENGEKVVGSPVADRVIARSPIQPGGFVDKAALESSLSRLSRHPGRRADAAISAAAEAGASPFDVDLNYTIAQSKPWNVYANISNTGTRQTNDWRERFGFSHTNLTGNDDVLQLDLVTASFDKSNAVFGSYEFPIWEDVLRFKLFGGWNQYTASDVGLSLGNIEGDGFDAGGEAIWQAIATGRYDMDVFAGLRYQKTKVLNNTLPGFPVEGDADFSLLSAGVRGQYRSLFFSTTSYNAAIEGTVSAPDQAEVDKLGRFRPDAEFAIFKGGLEHSMYIEPLIDGLDAATLAHEVYFSLRGQTSFGSRLAPIFQQVGGGFYSVRGYEESITAGDDAVVVTAEYKLHIPRLYSVSAQPGELFGERFRWRPQEPMGAPDWDLIFRGFLDAGRFTNADRKIFETDDTLIGGGIGLELQVKRNLFIRADWGFVLRSLKDAAGNTISDTGDNRLHFSATVAF